MHDNLWPELPLASWRATCETLHRWTQIVGKVKLALTPPEPEWAHVPLTVTARGLSTGAMSLGERAFEMVFDLVDHSLTATTSEGETSGVGLGPRSVAQFYSEVRRVLDELGVPVKIWPVPVEIANPVPFAQDREHASYDSRAVRRFLQVLLLADEALRAHRAPYRRRHTNVGFYWGTFDLAYARYSGRPAKPPSEDRIMRVAMDAEEVCAGFWPGDDRYPDPAFWCYAYPKPDGYENAPVSAPASWNAALGEFLLPYEAVCAADDPRATVLRFLEETYRAGAQLGRWDEAPQPPA